MQIYNWNLIYIYIKGANSMYGLTEEGQNLDVGYDFYAMLS